MGDLNGITVRRRAGRGPAIVFLPGYASDMAGTKALALDAWAERDGRAFVRFDYRGCGESAGAFADFTLDDWRDDALAVIDSIDGPVVLVGSSMGGWIMLLAALARPDKVVALAGLAAAPDFTQWGFDAAQKAAFVADGRVLEPSAYGPPLLTTRGFWESGQRNPVARWRDRDRRAGAADPGPVRPGRPVAPCAAARRTAAFGGCSSDPHQGRRPPPVAQCRHRAADPDHRKLAMIALFFLAAASVPAADAPDQTRFEACATLAEADPARALEQAGAWRVAGGGVLARQCEGLAFVTQKRWLPAATAFEGAAREADNRGDQRATNLWMQAGNAAMAAGDPARARTAFDAALARGQATGAELGELNLDRARARFALNDTKGARQDLDLAIKLAPADPLAWLLSATLARQSGDLDRARTDIAEAVKRAPDDAQVQLETGNIAIMSGVEDVARSAWQAAVKLSPQSPAGKSAAEALARLDAPATPGR